MKINIIVLITSCFFLFSCTHGDKDSNCKDFKSGTFYSTLSKDGSNNVISRSDTMQREYNLATGVIVWSKIKWINDCEYNLQYPDESINGYDSVGVRVKTRIFNNKILKTIAGEVNRTNYNYCVIESSLLGASQKIIDTLWKHDITD